MLLTTAASLSSSLLILFNNPAVSPFPLFCLSFISFLSHPYTDLQTCRHTHRRAHTPVSSFCVLTAWYLLHLRGSLCIYICLSPSGSHFILTPSLPLTLFFSVTRLLVSPLSSLSLSCSVSLCLECRLFHFLLSLAFFSLTSAPWHGGHSPLPHCSVRHL